MTGIGRPSVGYSLPVLRALNAHFMGWFLGTNLSKQIVVFLYLVDYNFVFFMMHHGDLMILLWNSWYFYGIHDTSMILLCKYIWKYHFVIHYVSVIYLQIMILWDFFQEKTFMCEWWRDGRICVICKRLSLKKRLPSLQGLAWPPSTSLRMVQRAIFR